MKKRFDSFMGYKNKYERVIKALEKGEEPSMKVFGQSMRPKIESGSLLTFAKTNDYQIGDVVFAKVSGIYIDAHLITKVGSDGRFMIANNHGHENGWASHIYGRVIAVNKKPFGRPKDDKQG